MAGKLRTCMKISAFILSLFGVLTSCGYQDPIDRIVKQESANEYFGNGMFMPIRLPATASPAEVTSKALALEQLGTIFTLLETRQVQIHADSGLPPEIVNYTAVLAHTGFGRKVVLLQFQSFTNHSCNAGWWCRVYDVK